MKKQIVCINWGTKYGAPYINRLYQMVKANITPPFRFVAFTDTRDGVLPDIDCWKGARAVQSSLIGFIDFIVNLISMWLGLSEVVL